VGSIGLFRSEGGEEEGIKAPRHQGIEQRRKKRKHPQITQIGIEGIEGKAKRTANERE